METTLEKFVNVVFILKKASNIFRPRYAEGIQNAVITGHFRFVSEENPDTEEHHMITVTLLVSFTAVFWDVTQRSPLGVALRDIPKRRLRRRL